MDTMLSVFAPRAISEILKTKLLDVSELSASTTMSVQQIELVSLNETSVQILVIVFLAEKDLARSLITKQYVLVLQAMYW